MEMCSDIFRIRAKEPIDIPRILSEISANSSGSPSTRDPNRTKLMKLVVSLPNDVQVDSPGTVEKLIKCKFSRGAVAKSSTVPTALEKKVRHPVEPTTLNSFP